MEIDEQPINTTLDQQNIPVVPAINNEPPLVDRVLGKVVQTNGGDLTVTDVNAISHTFGPDGARKVELKSAKSDKSKIYTREIVAGLITGFIVVINCVAVSKVLSGGQYDEFSNALIQMCLIGVLFAQFGLLLFSNYKNSVVSLSIEGLPFLFKVTDVINREMADKPMADRFTTYIFVVVLYDLTAGVLITLISLLGLGAFVDFVPLFVRSGVFATLGYFMYTYNFSITYPNGMTTEMFDYNLWLFFIPHICGIAMTILKIRYKNPFMIPGFFILATAIFYIVVAITGYKIDYLREKLFILSASNAKPFYNYYTNVNFKNTNFSLIFTNYLDIFLGALTGPVLNCALNSILLGYHLKIPINVKKETLAHGFMYTLLAFLGGFCAQDAMGYTATLTGIGGKTILSSLIFFGVLILFYFIHWILIVIGYLPRFVLSSFFVHVGLDIIFSSFYDIRYQVTYLEIFTMVIMVVISATIDYIWGIVFGLLFSFLLYMFQSSKTSSALALYTDAAQLGTVIIRPLIVTNRFKEMGRGIKVVELSGSIFFASSHQLVQKIISLIKNDLNTQLKITNVIISFTRVANMDSTAYAQFIEVFEFLKKHYIHFELVMTRELLRLRMLHFLEKSTLLRIDYEMYTSIDDAITGCEDTLSVVNSTQLVSTRSSRFVQAVQQVLRAKLGLQIDWTTARPLFKLKALFKVIISIPDEKLRKLLWHLIENSCTKMVIITQGRVLFKEDKKTDGIYCLIQGKITSYMGDTEERYIDRLSRTVVETNKLWVNKDPGTFIGTLPEPNTLTLCDDTAIADQTSLLLHISDKDFLSLNDENPRITKVMFDLDRTMRKRKFNFLKNRIKRLKEIEEKNNDQ